MRRRGCPLPPTSCLPPRARTHNCARRHASAELDNFPEGETEEMVQLYVKKGLPEPAARVVVERMATAPNFFIDVMMLEELQMSPPPAISAPSAAMRVGSAMLAGGGAAPLVATLLHRAAAEADDAPLATTTCAALVLLTAGVCPRSSRAARAGPRAARVSNTRHIPCLAVHEDQPAPHVTVAAALAYLGYLRASITHQGKGQLAVQTALLALVCTGVAQVAGRYLQTLG
jgi:hypothetical protein